MHRIVFIQYGDYAEAVRRFESGGDETYASQRYSVELVGRLAKEHEVSVICLPASPGKERLPDGVVAYGAGWSKSARPALPLLRLLGQLKPTHVVLRTPISSVLAWARLFGVRVLPIFADSFGATNGSKWSYRVLRYLLNSSAVPIIANHNLAASRSLASLGIVENKIVPWDWPQTRSPADLEPKTRARGSSEFSIIYAGTVGEAKGVSDLIRALALLRDRGHHVAATVAGPGDIEAMIELARELGVAEHVTFLGRISNAEVFEWMRRCDAVVVPSRPEYPEGLPIVITEGLCSRSPVLLSEHPVFLGALGGQPGIKWFAPANPEKLAHAIADIAQDPELYCQLSQDGVHAWRHTQVQMTWGELVMKWLSGTPRDLELLGQYALAAR